MQCWPQACKPWPALCFWGVQVCWHAQLGLLWGQSAQELEVCPACAAQRAAATKLALSLLVRALTRGQWAWAVQIVLTRICRDAGLQSLQVE